MKHALNKKIDLPYQVIKQKFLMASRWLKTKYQDPNESNLFAKRLNVIFLALGLILAITLLVGGIASIPFTGGGSSIFIGLSIKLFFLLNVTTAITSIGRNFGRLFDTLLNPYISVRDKALTFSHFLIASVLVIIFWKFSLIKMIASFISPLKNIGINLFAKILFSCSFTAIMISSSDIIKNFINIFIYRFREPNISKATRIGNLIGCISGLIISILLVCFHDKIGCISPLVEHLSLIAKLALTTLNMYLFTGIFSRIGKHIGNVITLVNDKNRSSADKAVALLWLIFCVTLPAICIFNFHLQDLHNGLIIISNTLKSWEIQCFFTVALSGMLISCGTKFGQAVDILKKPTLQFYHYVKNILTSQISNETAQNELTNKKSSKLLPSNFFLFKKAQIIFTATLAVFITLINPLPTYANSLGKNSESMESFNNGETSSARKDSDVKTNSGNNMPTEPSAPNSPLSSPIIEGEESRNVKDNRIEKRPRISMGRNSATILKKLTPANNHSISYDPMQIAQAAPVNNKNNNFSDNFLTQHAQTLSAPNRLPANKITTSNPHSQSYEHMTETMNL